MIQCKNTRYKGLRTPRCNGGNPCKACRATYKKNVKYRFFYHYRKSDGRMSVHFQGRCIPVQDVDCHVPCETKRNKRQPLLVMQGFCKTVTVSKGKATIK